MRLENQWQQLLDGEVVGIRSVGREPPKGWRDDLWKLATAIGTVGAISATALATHHWLAVLAGIPVAAFGYRRQFRRSVWKRRPRLSGVAPLVPPPGGLHGVVAAWERRLSQTGVVAARQVLRLGDAVVFQEMRSVPFLLRRDDHEQPVAVHGGVAVAPGEGAVDEVLAALELPPELQLPPKVHVVGHEIREGDRVRILGDIEEELTPGLGYRGARGLVIRGGRPWVVREDS